MSEKRGTQPPADNLCCPEGKRCIRRDASSLLSPCPRVVFSTILFESGLCVKGYLKISKLIRIIYGIEAEIARKTNRLEMKYG